MDIDKIPDTVYHGTTSCFLSSFNEGIDLSKGNNSADFGKGFYTTSNYQQAKLWAKLKTDNRNELCENNKVCTNPMILTYTVDKKQLASLQGLLFDGSGDKWKEFIYNNRMFMINKQISDFKNNDAQYPFVYGEVADSKISRIMYKVKTGKMNYQDFKSALEPLHSFQSDQLSFHSKEALSALTLTNIELVTKEVTNYV